jgi:hypothetical protein
MVERMHAEERHHLEWVERTLARRPWESGAHRHP